MVVCTRYMQKIVSYNPLVAPATSFFLALCMASGNPCILWRQRFCSPSANTRQHNHFRSKSFFEAVFITARWLLRHRYTHSFSQYKWVSTNNLSHACHDIFSDSKHKHTHNWHIITGDSLTSAVCFGCMCKTVRQQKYHNDFACMPIFNSME